MTDKKRGGWVNPASADNGHAGGRMPVRFTLSRPAAIYLRALTQSQMGRAQVTQAECNATLETLLREHAAARYTAAGGSEETG